MLRIYHGNRLERLFDAFASELEHSRDPLGGEWIAVRGSGMRGWLSRRLASRFGVWAGSRPVFLRDLVRNLMSLVIPGIDDELARFDRPRLDWTLLDILTAADGDGRLGHARDYLENDPRGVKVYQLCEMVARVFDEYALYRPDMVAAWEGGSGGGWQGVLWREVMSRMDGIHVAGASRMFMDALEEAGVGERLPDRIFLFGMSSMPPAHVEVLAALPDRVEVDLFVLTPTREYWGDVRPGSRGLHGAGGAAPHPLLATCGRLGRDFQEILLDADHRVKERIEIFDDPGGRGDALSWIQSDILSLVRRGERAGGAPSHSPLPLTEGDRSVIVSSCHSPAREVEVLRDQILDFLDDSAGTARLEDVLVLAVDMSVYAPFVESVFEEAGIPFTMIGAGQAGNRAMEVLEAVFDAVRGRASVQEVFDILALDPVRARWGLSLEDVDRALDWIVRSGVRWGIDAEHRGAFGQPAVERNTWRSGIDRLLLGYALPPEGIAMFEGVLPLDAAEGAESSVLEGLVEFLGVLFGHLREMSAPRTVDAWRARIVDLLEDLVGQEKDLQEDLQSIRDGLARLDDGARDAGFAGEIHLEVFRAALAREIGGDRGAIARGAGGVTFSDLVSMGSVPADAICLLGVNDGEFPRTRKLPSFDLTAAEPRPGDRSVRNDDLYLFLECVMGARRRLIISYVGQCERTSRPLGASVVVGELLDLLEETFRSPGGPGAVAGAVLTEHPLRAYSPSYFDGSREELFSYSEADLARAEALEAGRAAPASGRGKRFAPAGIRGLEEPAVISARDLASFFRLPPRYFARRRLGIRPAGETAPPEAGDLISLGPLEEHGIGQELLDLAVSADGRTSAEAFEAAGRLPIGTPGDTAFGRLWRAVEPVAKAVRSLSSGPLLDPVELDLEVCGGRARVVGAVGGILEGGRLGSTYSRLRARHLLQAWIEHVLLNAAAPGSYPRQSVLVGRGARPRDAEVCGFSQLEDPGGILDALVDLYLKGQTAPLRFAPQPSMAFAETMRSRQGDAEAAMEAAKRALDSSYDLDDPSVVVAWRGLDILSDEGIHDGEGFAEIATAVFDPLLEYREEARR